MKYDDWDDDEDDDDEEQDNSLPEYSADTQLNPDALETQKDQ